MIAAVRQGAYMMWRELLARSRQRWWIAVTLVQPVIWLLLYGALFRRVVEIPGFHSGSYIEFLAPGVVIMTALFSAGWGGLGMIGDIDTGVVDRLLVSPVRRGALVIGRLMQTVLNILIQSIIIVMLAVVVGARFPAGVGGVLGLLIAAMLLGASVSALSDGLALLTRRSETLIAVMNFLLLPLTFLSSAFMQKDLMPAWMRVAADLNPVNWAVEAGRMALLDDADWVGVGLRSGLLLVMLAGCVAFATCAFRVYQRSV